MILLDRIANVEEIGGNHTPALGFAMGMERLLMLMEAQGIEFPPEAKCDLYIASMGENATLKASQIASSVEKRTALTFPVFSLERFTLETPTFSESSFSDIFRLAIITSRFTTIAIRLRLSSYFLQPHWLPFYKELQRL